MNPNTPSPCPHEPNLKSNYHPMQQPPMITTTRAAAGGIAMKKNRPLMWGCWFSRSRAMNSTS